MKIPAQAKRVFKGVIFDVYQWEQLLYDGTTATFEALKRPSTIQIIPTLGEKIFLSHEEQPAKPRTYSFLGGRAEPNEEPLVTAKRELLEESGLVSKDWELYKVYQNPGKIDWTIYLFIARNCEKIQDPHLDAGEKIDVKEVSFDKFLEIVSAKEFWAGNISSDILRLRLNPGKLKVFRDKLFKNNTQ